MSEDDNLSENQKKIIEEERAKFKKENPKETVIRIENETSLQAERVFDDLKNTVIKEFEARKIPIDPSSLKTKEDLESHFEAIRKMQTDEKEIEGLRKAQVGSSGVPLNSEQMGKDWNKENSPKGERSTEHLKKIAQEIPLDMLDFHNESEMLRTLEAIRTDTNHPECKNAEHLYQQVLAHTFQRTGTIEFQAEGKEFGKKEGKWKKKQGSED